jgi:repressor LexA
VADQQVGLQEQVLVFLRQFVNQHGYPPTYEEIREAVGLSSKSHVSYYLAALEQLGLIERTPRAPRSLRLLGGDSIVFTVPVEGCIAPGLPVERVLNSDEYIELTPDIADPDKDLYALQVRGEGLIGDLVADGDIIIIERQQSVRRRQTSVAPTHDHRTATLKSVELEADRVRAQSVRTRAPAIYLDTQDPDIQGRVVAIIRQL